MIVFAHLLNDNSGSPIVLREVIRCLSQREDALLFVGSQGRGRLEESEARIVRYWYRRSRFRIVTLFTYALSQAMLYRALSRNRALIPVDAVIYVNTLLPFGAALWGRRHGRRVVYHVHEVSISPAPLRRFLVSVAQRTAARVIYVSADNRARLPIPGAPSAVAPNAVSPELAEAGRNAVYAPRRSGRFEILMLASPRDFKGVPEFLALALALIDREDIAFRLVLNGDPGEVERYLPPAARPGNVTVAPRTNAPAALYAQADLLVNLSRVDQWIETFGMTLLEAMCFGAPVIAPPVGGPVEIVRDGVEGYLIDSRDGAALKDAVLRLADDPELALSLSARARRRAAEFSVQEFSARLRRELWGADAPTEAS